LISFRKAWQAVLLIIAFTVAGCVGNPMYDEGKRLIAQGQVENGLSLLEQTAKDNPRDQKLRFEWIRQRDLYVGRLLVQAETARVNGQVDDAAAAYWRALQLDPANARAKAGFESVHLDRKHASLVRDAEALIRKKDLKGAEEKLRLVLADNPAHRGARSTLRQITDLAASRSLEPPTLKGAIGKRVTLQFREANLRSVFDVISRTTGLNFVFDRDVRPDLRTTIVVRDSSVEDVLNLILATNQLQRKVLNENSVLIYPNTAAKQKEYQELVVRSFYVSNIDVKQVLNMIRTVVKTRDLFMDEKLNLLVMKDTPEAIRLAEKLIAAQDLAEPEVTLEVEVLEVGSSRVQELGVRFPDRIQFQDPLTVGATGTTVPLQRASADLVGFVATPAMVLNIRQTDGLTNVLANPRIRVRNREKAKIHIGDKVPVVTTTSAVNVGTSSSVSYLDVGLKLEVEPTIYLEGDVAMRVVLEVSNIVKEIPTTGGGLAYQIGTRNASTLLRLKDGETQILAGLIQDDERTTANKVPLLGDMPVLGRLFSNNLENRTKSEIVLLITPRVVRNIHRPEHVVAEYYSGTESAIGASPLIISATRPGALALSGRPGAASPQGKPEARSAAAAAGQEPSATLTLDAPAETNVGKEFVVKVTLADHPNATSAELQIAYDPAVITTGSGDGTAAFKLEKTAAGPVSAEARFRVVAKEAAQVQLAIEGATVRNAAGDNLPLSLPPPRELRIAP
jgi:general secretion pathway protein D